MKTLIADRFGRVLIAVGCTVAMASAEPQVLLRPAKLAEMDTAIVQAIADKQCSGGVLWVEHNGASYHKTFGKRALVPAEEPMTGDTIFDVASLTKVVACTPAVMLLVERGKVKLDEPARTYLPEFTGGGKESITVRQLMTHVSGLRPDIETRSDWEGQPAAIQKACEEKLQAAPGTMFRYSDINFFLLGEIVQRVSQTPLEEFVQREIYHPLRMDDTGYLPLAAGSRRGNEAERPVNVSATNLPPHVGGYDASGASMRDRIAPTEVVDGKPRRGVVHDPTARKMGGVAGHAGLFTTASDLARYARMLLNDGALDGVRVFKPETIRLMTSVQTPPAIAARRGLGWDIDSGYSVPRGGIFPLGSFGHTGWTGTSLWIDPFSKTFVIFLSNRNHPAENGSVSSLRAQLGTLAAEAVADFDFSNVPAQVEKDSVSSIQSPLETENLKLETSRRAPPRRVLNGIDVLVKNHFAPLKGKRIGLITNPTGHDRDRNPTIDLLKRAPGVQLVALFSPEHGIRGVADEQVADGKDEMTGLPIYSLYGATRKPKPEHLKDLDALVFDLQDIGCRFYTYASTLGLVLEAASENGKQIFVLDRVSPINGVTIDGPVLAGPPTFVGFYKVPLRHGMTLGELAQMYNAEKDLKADLTVIEIENWRRDQWFDDTGLPWTNPSPNLWNLKQATLYPGVGLLEIALSVGRGTDTPFEVVGAPYIDDVRFAEELNRAGLPGVSFVPVRFTPASSVHQGQNCGGVHIMLNDRNRCNVVDVGLQMAKTLFRLYPKDFNPDKIGHLLLHQPTLAAIKMDKPLSEIRASWKTDLDEFQTRRARYLIYQ